MVDKKNYIWNWDKKSILGIVDFIHFNKKFLFDNKHIPEVQEVLRIILRLNTRAMKSKFTSNLIQSSYLEFIYKLFHPSFNNFLKKKLVYEMKLELQRNLTKIIKKNGGECSMIIKVTQRDNKNGKRLK